MAGLTVYNDSGVAQIDSEHRNIRLRAKGTLTADLYLRGRPGGGSLWYAGLAVDAARPMFAFSSTAQVRCMYVTQDSTPVMAFHVINQQGASINWWQFETGTTAEYGSGIRIFNAAGEQVFDGGDKLPTVVGFTQTLGGTIDTSAGRLAMCMSLGTPQVANGIESNLYASISGSSCAISMVADRFNSIGTRIPSPTQLLFLDVAGL